MDTPGEKTLTRIESVLDKVAANAQYMADDVESRSEQMSHIESLLEKLLEQAEAQTALLQKLWANDRGRG